MVQTIRIDAVARADAGKGAARATRRQGLVPAVVYGAKQPSTLCALDPRDVMKQLVKGSWQSHLFEVAVKDGPTERSVMRDVQFDPVTDRPIHVDFQRVAPGARIRVRVAVQFLHQDVCPGVKAGGSLNIVRHDIEVMAEIDKGPEQFQIDLSAAKIGDSLRFSTILDKFGARPVITGRDFVVATIAAPVVEEVVVAPVAAPADAKGKAKAKAPAKAAAPAAKAAAPAAPAKKK